MQNISDSPLVRAVQQLVAIESTVDNPAGLRGAYAYMRELVEASGKPITIEEFERGGKPSFLAYQGAERPECFHIILNAHVDVVPGKPEQFVPYIQDGKLYGRGTYDMKAAAIVLANTFCEYVDKVPYALGLQIVTDEESTGKNGTAYQVEEGVKSDFVICGECGRNPGTYEIANEAKGIANMVLRFDGDSAHGAYPWRGNNAALKATDFVHKLQELFPVPEAATNGTTVSVTGVLAGGTIHNQTPELATVHIDCRYARGDTRFASIEAITTFIHSIDPEATITQFINYGSPTYTNPDNSLLLKLKHTAEEIEGRAFTFVRRNGTSDSRYYAEVGGETCEFGIVGEHQHSDGECITLEALENYEATMRSFFQKTIVTEVVQQPAEAVHS